MPEKGASALARRLPSPTMGHSRDDSPKAARNARTGGIRTALLRLRVHLDGFRLDPATYLAGAWWRLMGKRLRSRARLAPLIGLSPGAYHLWLARHRQSAPASAELVATPLAPPFVVVVVDARGGGEGLDDTLASIGGRASRVIVLGGQARQAIRASSPLEAAALVDWVRDPWLMPLRAGDRLAPGALNHYARVARAGGATLIYADDDAIGATGSRHAPHFKPAWNEELLRHHDYVTGTAMVRVSREAFERAAVAPDWMERLTAHAAGDTEPVHLPLILHHRRQRPLPRVPASAVDNANGALPRVSIIVPTRNRVELLRTCLDGITGTDYPGIETIVVDNDSDDPETLEFLASRDPDQIRVLRQSGPFNYSAINNAAVTATNGSLLCFLNNDIEVLQPDWLELLARHAVREGVGAVGPMLLYPDGTVQHAGVVTGVGGGAGHAHRNLRPDEEGYFHRHALPQFVSAVTGACLVVMRDRFDEVGGFDERNFPVAFNDVDLCLKLGARGYRSFYEPRARLVHHESKSRGNDRDAEGARRLAGELAALKRKWHTDTRTDPYHHPLLSPYSEQFVVDL